MKTISRVLVFFGAAALLTSCNDDFSWISLHEDPRVVYAPNMYYSEAYEPLSQITDEDAGAFVDSDEDYPYGEYFNSNVYNRYPSNSYTPMNMRDPAPNTVKRGNVQPYRLAKDSLEAAKRVNYPDLIDPMSPAALADGKILYGKFCQHCHGASGAGDGPVSQAFPGVANLTTDRVKAYAPGQIFHIITHGYGRMWPHGSQIQPAERWLITAFVKNEIQKTDTTAAE